MSKWIEVVELARIPVLGSRVIKTCDMDIALFRDSNNRVYAIRDAYPQKSGPLSQGIMHGTLVTCPLLSWKVDLTCGKAMVPDEKHIDLFPVKVEEGKVFLQLTPAETVC